MRRMGSGLVALAVGLAIVNISPAKADDAAMQPVQPSAGGSGEAAAGSVEVQLCDGETSIQVAANEAPTRESGQQIADELMGQWKRAHPDEDWVDEEQAKHAIVEPHDNSDLIGQGQGATYGKITEEDVAIWQRESLKLVAEGSRIFHSADALGSDIAVSCDMCHPNAANTHPETYPKFQVQLARVALLRDMINWCIEHPVRGDRLAQDDPRMRALEAYIYAQRAGTPLAYGKR